VSDLVICIGLVVVLYSQLHIIRLLSARPSQAAWVEVSKAAPSMRPRAAGPRIIAHTEAEEAEIEEKRGL
jgi:hypothetical protein